MNRILALAALLLVSLPACGPAAPAQAPEAAGTAEPAASASAAPSAEPSAAPEAPQAEPAKPAPTAETSPAETLARDLVKAGGRRIGYSGAKKRFVIPVEQHADGGRGLDLRFYDDEGQQREVLRVCQPGECEEHLNEIAKDLVPKLVARFEKEGFEAIYAVGWPTGRDELDLSTVNVRLRADKGRLAVVNEKKSATPLRALGGKSPKGAPSAVYPVPAAKLLGVVVEGERDFYVFKLP